MDGTRVAIVGAGLAGVTSCAALIRAGFPPEAITVFESSDHLGGVWGSGGAYDGLVSNTPGKLHALFGQSTPRKDELATTHRMPQSAFVRRLESYAEEHGVTPRIRLRCKVERVVQEGTAWRITFVDNRNKSRQVAVFDRLILCHGQYGRAHVPPFAAPLRWSPALPDSKVFHSFDLSHRPNLDSLKTLASSSTPSEPGHIIVVGAFQSAIELATMLAKSGRRVTWLLRRAGWFFPSPGDPGVPDGDGAALGSTSRYGSLRLPFYRETVGNGSTILYVLLQRFFHATWYGRKLIAQGVGMLEAALSAFFGWDVRRPPLEGVPVEKTENPFQALKPDHGMFWSFGHICVAPLGTRDLIARKQLSVGRATITALTERTSGITAHLSVTGSESSSALDADAVVFATGAEPNLPDFLDPVLAAKLGFYLTADHDPTVVAEREAPYHSLDAAELDRLVASHPSIAHPPEGRRPITNIGAEAQTRERGWSPRRRTVAPMRLFRGIIPVDSAEDRNFAVVGAGVISFGGALTTQSQAEWVADYFKGGVLREHGAVRARGRWGTEKRNVVNALPSREEMMRDASARVVWARWLFDTTGAEGTWFGPHAVAYADTLTRDMGLDGPLPFKWFRPSTWRPWLYSPPLPSLYGALWDQKRLRDARMGFVM